MTRRNKLLCGALSVLIAAQLSAGIYFAVADGTGQSEFFGRLFVRTLSHRSSVQPPPQVNLALYNICIPQEQRPAELAFNSVSVAFGAPLPSDFQRDFTLGALMFFASHVPLYWGMTDILMFLIILATAKGPSTSRFPGVPTILDAILRDTTLYFLVMVAVQFLLFFSSLFAPVSDPYHIGCWLVLLYSSLMHTQTQIRFLPGL